MHLQKRLASGRDAEPEEGRSQQRHPASSKHPAVWAPEASKGMSFLVGPADAARLRSPRGSPKGSPRSGSPRSGSPRSGSPANSEGFVTVCQRQSHLRSESSRGTLALAVSESHKHTAGKDEVWEDCLMWRSDCFRLRQSQLNTAGGHVQRGC